MCRQCTLWNRTVPPDEVTHQNDKIWVGWNFMEKSNGLTLRSYLWMCLPDTTTSGLAPCSWSTLFVYVPSRPCAVSLPTETTRLSLTKWPTTMTKFELDGISRKDNGLTLRYYLWIWFPATTTRCVAPVDDQPCVYVSGRPCTVSVPPETAWLSLAKWPTKIIRFELDENWWKRL